MDKPNLIIYNTQDGKPPVTLLSKEGSVWMTQAQLAELFSTSVPNISMHISNILNEQETAAEIDSLNRFVVVFLETAELRAKNRQDITIDFWHSNIDKIIDLNHRPVLDHLGSISHQQMKDTIDIVYTEFYRQRKIHDAAQADAEELSTLKQIEQLADTIKRGK